MKTTWILSLCVMIAIGIQPSAAQQPGWTFTAGLGVGSENVYPGAEDFFVTPLPSASASYTAGSTSYSISILEGLGITHVIPRWGLIADVNLNAGPRRDAAGYSVLGVEIDHTPSTQALLVGAPDLDAPFVLKASLLRATPIGLLGASVGVHRTSVESPQQQETRTGLLYSLQYLASRQPMERLTLSGLLSLEIMDQTFADTWHSRRQAGPSTDAFEANAGLRGSLIAVEAQYWFSDRVSLAVLGGSTVLMGDAKNSPFTADRVQRVMRTQLLYQF